MRIGGTIAIVAAVLAVLLAVELHSLRESIFVARRQLTDIERVMSPPPANMDLSTPRRDFADIHKPYLAPLPFGGQNPVYYKKMVACGNLNDDRTMVLLALGQSNAANMVGRMARAAAGGKVMNYYAGHCYTAEDPLLGATGDGGSVWTEFANRVVADGLFDRVVVVVHAVGGTSLASWVPGEPVRSGLDTLMENLRAAGIRPTHTFWIQGEADAYPSSPYYADGPAYTRDLVALLRGVAGGQETRVFIALASSCPNQFSQTGPHRPIRAAQASAIEQIPGARVAADLDSVSGFEDRYDGCHLTGIGATKVVDQMMAALRVEVTRSYAGR